MSVPYHRIEKLNYTSDQLFDLVADIDKYHEFLPWCKASRVLRKEDDNLQAELLIAYEHLSKSYISQVDFLRKEQGGKILYREINVESIKGPFNYLKNNWKFYPIDPDTKNQTKLEFFVDFQFESKMLDMMLGRFFDNAVIKMFDSFVERAEVLYGNNKKIQK